MPISSGNVRAALVAAADRNLPLLVETTRALVGAGSPNPPGDTSAVADVAQGMLATIPGIEIRRFEPQPGIVSLLARLHGRQPGRRLIFNGHLDTFPIGDEADCTFPPLSGAVCNGRIYGRGVSDMKGGVACSILATSLLAAQHQAWDGEVVVTLAGESEHVGSGVAEPVTAQVSATGLENVSVCQPEAVSPVNVPVASRVPVELHRVPVWAPVLAALL